MFDSYTLQCNSQNLCHFRNNHFRTGFAILAVSLSAIRAVGRYPCLVIISTMTFANLIADASVRRYANTFPYPSLGGIFGNRSISIACSDPKRHFGKLTDSGLIVGLRTILSFAYCWYPSSRFLLDVFRYARVKVFFPNLLQEICVSMERLLFREDVGEVPVTSVVKGEIDGASRALFHQCIAGSKCLSWPQDVPSCLRGVCPKHLVAVCVLGIIHEAFWHLIVAIPHP